MEAGCKEKSLSPPPLPVASQRYIHLEDETMDHAVLLTCLRNVFPTKRNFPDDLLLAEIGTKSEQARAVAQFNGYINRNVEASALVQRNAAIVEGDKLLRIVMRQMQE